MNKFILGIAAVAASLFAAPAIAQDSNFEGGRFGAVVGASGDASPFDEAELTYGAQVGYDFAVSPNFLLGAEADIANADIEGIDARQISAGVRATVPVSARTALYASGGYSNLRVEFAGLSDNVDGFRLGGGAEFTLGKNVYATGEYRYSEYDLSAYGASGHVNSALFGLGLRF